MAFPLSVILLSVAMILLSTLRVIRSLICGCNYSWFLNFNQNYETLDWDREWLVDLNVKKVQVVSFDRSSNTSVFDLKMDGSVPKEKNIF